MGRLQRKKDQSKKKARVRKDDIQTDGGNDSVAVKKTGFEQKKKFDHGSAPVKYTEKDNFISNGLRFLREVKVELKKVTWPSKKQTMGSTVVVIILVMIISLFLGVVDVGLSSLIRTVIQ